MTESVNSNIPNLFIVGAAKSGTTSLYEILKHHPDVYMSPIKEPNYFSDDIDIKLLRSKLKSELEAENWPLFIEGNMNKSLHTAFIRSKDQYQKLFRFAKNKKIIGEASVSYLYSEAAARNIYRFNPEAKIIILLRNPVERAFSHYLMERRLTLTQLSFGNDLQKDIVSKTKAWGATPLYIELGLYYEQVQRFLNIFSEKNVSVILFEDFNREPQNVMNNLFSFLGIESIIIKEDVKHNASLIPRNIFFEKLAGNQKLKVKLRKLLEQMRIKEFLKNIIFKSNHQLTLSGSDRKLLSGYFDEDLKKLSSLIRRNLDHWLSK